MCIRDSQNPPNLKFDRDRVRIFQRNVQTSEKFEQLKNLVNRTELNKPDLDHCVLRLILQEKHVPSVLE